MIGGVTHHMLPHLSGVAHLQVNIVAVAVVVAYKLPIAWSLHGVFPGLLGEC